jgi:DNA polymerase
MTKSEQLEQVKQKIIDDKVCSTLQAQAMSLVFGSGNPDAKIFFIGEAPGEAEDRSGEPFVGAAGKFLNEMLQSINLNRADVYITNIVKYRPPNNRDPLPEEKQQFWSYLVDQIKIIQPRLIVTLGRHSLNCFEPAAKISVVHGKPQSVTLFSPSHKINKFEVILLPLYHPAAALYNGSMRKTLIEDFKQIKEISNIK